MLLVVFEFLLQAGDLEHSSVLVALVVTRVARTGLLFLGLRARLLSLGGVFDSGGGTLAGAGAGAGTFVGGSRTAIMSAYVNSAMVMITPKKVQRFGFSRERGFAARLVGFHHSLGGLL